MIVEQPALEHFSEFALQQVDRRHPHTNQYSWDSKFHFGFWRPVTAIQLAEGDGNPDTHAVEGWLPWS